MSNKGKFYLINLDVFNSKTAEIGKLPPQQQQILKTMAKHCHTVGLKGSDIIQLAVDELGLQTRQKYTVLYAWYARSNENYGVYLGRDNREVPKVEDKDPNQMELPLE